MARQSKDLPKSGLFPAPMRLLVAFTNRWQNSRKLGQLRRADLSDIASGFDARTVSTDKRKPESLLDKLTHCASAEQCGQIP